jgi:hypothetical protein
MRLVMHPAVSARYSALAAHNGKAFSMKKIVARKAGPIKLTTAASAYWPPLCPVAVPVPA